MSAKSILSVVACAAISAFGALTQPTAYTYVADGETVVVAEGDSVANAATMRYNLGAGCTLKLTGTAAADGALFEFKPQIYTTNSTGGVTIDASGLSGYSGIRWSNSMRVDGALSVKGLGLVVFGNKAAVASSDINSPCWWADSVAFDVDSPAGVVFTNGVCMVTEPNCAWSVADGTWFWPYADNWTCPGDVLSVTNCNLGIVNTSVLVGKTVKVGAGCQIAFRKCGINETSSAEFSKWGGGAGTWEGDVVLDGGEAHFVSTQSFVLDGSLTGTGEAYYKGNAGYVQIAGASTFSGPARVTSGSTKSAEFVFCENAPEVLFSNTSYTRAVSFKPRGAGTSVTSARLEKLCGGSVDNHVVKVQDHQTVTLADASGQFRVSASAVDAAFVVENVSAAAVIRVPDGVDFTVKAAAADSPLTIELVNSNGTGEWKLNGAEADAGRVAVTLSCAEAAPKFTLGGKLDVSGMPSDASSITLRADADVTGLPPVACGVRSLGAGVTLPMTTWRAKVGLWLDAAASDSIVLVKDTPLGTNVINNGNSTQNGGKETIHTWKDARADHDVWAARNLRYGDTEKSISTTIFPVYEPEGGPDGKPFVSFATGGSSRLGIAAGSAGTSYKSVPGVKWAMVVFGSQNEKPGHALLSTTNQMMMRAGNSRSLAVFTNELFTSYYLDGTATAASTKNAMNGGWQIFSFDAHDAAVDGLNVTTMTQGNGMGVGHGKANYAEVLLFSETPSDEERKAAEKYLADKWGLTVSHAGGTAEQAVSGNGAISLAGDMILSGNFSGTLALNGNRLVIEPGLLAGTAADVPAADVALWLDPSAEGKVVMGGDAAKPDEVNAVVPVAGKFYGQSAYSADGVTNRRARLVVDNVGGAAAKWLDFADGYNDGYNNNLMLQENEYKTPPPDNYAAISSVSGWVSVNYKSIFVVTDTTRGGGTPICHYAGAGSGDVIMRGGIGAIPKVTDRVWNENCTAIIKNGSTWLDGVAIDGNEAGFSGRPEVMSFQPADEGGTKGSTSTSVKAFACLAVQNEEKLGEAIALKTKVDDATRTKIETYLMKKWLGKLPAGYVDFRDVTVSGDGEVSAPSVAALPQFASDFSGTVELASVVSLAFHFAEGATEADEAHTFPANGSVKFGASLALDVEFASRPAEGRYALLVGAIADGTEFTLGTVTGAGGKTTVRVVKTADGLFLDVRPQGTAIIVR